MKKRIGEILRKIRIFYGRVWQDKKWRVVFVVFLTIGILLTSFTIRSWFSSPREVGYPEISYAEFRDQIERENVESFSLKYIDEERVAEKYKSGLAVIFVKLKNGDIFTTGEINFTEISPVNFINHINGNNVGYLLLRHGQESLSLAEYILGHEPAALVILGELKTGEILITDFSPFIDSVELFDILWENSINFYEITIQQEIGLPQPSFFENRQNLTIIAGIFWLGFILLFLIPIVRKKRGEVGVSLGPQGKKVNFPSISSLEKRVTFQDVAGVDEAKQDLEEVLTFFKSSDKFIKMGARMPRGLLFMGSPGTGKTLLARALACEAGISFKSVSGSEFVEKYVGVGASRVRDLFRQARSEAPCIIFIDEIDAIGKRTPDAEGGVMEHHHTLTQILHEMDGFTPNEKILVIAATNQPEAVDPALMRPGRFDRQIVFPAPDLKGREAILEVHTRNKPLAASVNLKEIAQMTPLGFSGADLANVANEAAIRAVLSNKERIEKEDFEKAIEKVLVGSERKSMIVGEEDKWIIAYHETGHILVAKFTPDINPPQKVSIVPTVKGAGGYTKLLAGEERFMMTRKNLLAQIQVSLGGRIAEEMIFGKEGVSTGADEDLERCTGIAEQMVCEYAMADEELGLGLRTFGKKRGLQFLGGFSRQKDYSEEDAQKISQAMNKIIGTCYQKAKNILEENRDVLMAVAKGLKEKETLDIGEIDRIYKEIKKP